MFQLPKDLKKYRHLLEPTVQSCVEIKGVKQPTSPFQSKFFGNPYFPKGMDYPVDQSGKPMVLLAQLNFAEIPSLDDMPASGILQFYLSAEDDAMGIDFNELTNQENFRVIYHEEIEYDESKLITNFSFLATSDNEYLPGVDESALTFSKTQEVISFCDFRFDDVTEGKIDLEEEGEEGDLWSAFDEITTSGHKIGGYPYFTQYDPREDRYENHTVLLFQMDTDDELEIMWGDSGVGNFFITPEDLKNRDFSNVLFTWDCC